MQDEIMKYKMSVHCDHYFHHAICCIREDLQTVCIFAADVSDLQCDALVAECNFSLMDQAKDRNVGQDHSKQPSDGTDKNAASLAGRT